MKTFITAAIMALSIAATSTAALAGAPAKTGHYEWRTVTQPGLNKSNLPNMRRVWVVDAPSEMALNNMPCAGMACCKPDSAT